MVPAFGSPAPKTTYIESVGKPTMAINAVLNSLTGPGGQYSGASTSFGDQTGPCPESRQVRRGLGPGPHGGETGSTAGERFGFRPAWYRRYRAI